MYHHKQHCLTKWTAYTFIYELRLDLDDYNKEVEEGCHITSMAGTWMSIVEGFGGMRIKQSVITFHQIPKEWEGYSQNQF
jgi:maltose phosphorylase